MNTLGSQVLLEGGEFTKKNLQVVLPQVEGTLHFNLLKKIPLKDLPADMAV